MRNLAFLAVILSACGGGGMQQQMIDANTGPVVLDPPPPPGGQQLTSDQYTVPAGTEKYFCYTFHSPADGERAITKVEPIAGANGIVVHHTVVFKTTVPEPEGFSECPVLVKTSWQPIWAGGAGSPGLQLPDNVGFKIAPNTQYLVQYHLNNSTDADIVNRSAINFTYAPDSTAVMGAGLFALGSFNLDIPAMSTGYQQVISCNADRDMHLFAAFPHMHKLGTGITYETGATEATAQMVYSKTPWVFGNQPMDPIDLQVHQGDFLRATCTWDNPGPTDVMFGESTTNEMCFMVTFYYPSDGNPAGCVQ